MTLGQFRLLTADYPDGARLELSMKGGDQSEVIVIGDHQYYPMPMHGDAVVIFEIRIEGARNNG